MFRKVLLYLVLLTLAVSGSSLGYSISRDWQQSVSSSSTETIDRIQVYLAAGKNSSGVDINEFQLTPYALRLANNTKVWVSGTTTQTGWYDNGSGYEPVPTFWGVPNSSGLTIQTTTVNPDTGLYETYVEPMQNWVSADKKVAVIEAPSFILGTFLGIREYWTGTSAPAQAYQATVYYQFYRNGTLVTSATYDKPAGSTSWTKTVTGTSSQWAQGFININPSFTITASAGTGGSINPAGAVSVDSGDSQSFTITPNSGYAISQVTVDGVNQGAISSYTFNNVTANHTISATFSANTYTITASAGANGSISPSGAVSVSSGANQLFTMTPNSGYVVSQVTVDGVNQGALTSYTFTNVTANHTISATFTTQAPPPTGLVMELRPQDFTGTQWPIYQGSLKDADPSKAYFAPNGTPQYVPSVAGTGHSGIGMNNAVWDYCVGMGGPIAPSTITGNNPRTIEAWSFNPALAGEETLVDLCHRGGTVGQHFGFENGNNWALNGTGTGDVTNWNSSNRQNRWVHLVVTYESGVAKFYVDGVLTVTKNCTYDIFAGDSIAIGSQRTAATTTSNSTSNLNYGVYMGYIGNVRIYDAALTATEVTGRFNLGVNGGEATATSYTVSGTVTTGSTGIAGATVYFSKSANASLSPVYTATTDASGNYSQALPSGTWYIAAAKGRYTPHPTADTVVNLTGNTSGKNFTLTYVSTPTKLIDMDAEDLVGNNNDPVSSWTNAGTLGGTFSLDGTDQTTRPIISTAIGRRCVSFDGTNDRLKLFNGSTPINAPSGITGNSDWTVEGWYLNPALGSTECYLSWANSNDIVGARAGFMYGSHNGDGAVMHGTGPLLNYNMAMIPLPTTGR